MRIVCDACDAKYSIADDKVRGKVFKIRCKKCSNVIMVRGVSAAVEPELSPQTRVVHDGDEALGNDAVWHLVIEQDQVGPMTVGEIRDRFAAGEISGETFAWREGLADWLPIAQLDVFASLVAPAAAHEPTFEATIDQAVASARIETAAARLRGERNESSVLFSLNNLATIASQRPVAAATASQLQGTSAGEGSGLIDIRSMASAYGGGAGAAVAKPAATIGSLDDLPVFGGGGFSEPAVLVPQARASNAKLLYVMIGVMAVFAVAATVMIALLLRGDPAPARLAAVTPVQPVVPVVPVAPVAPIAPPVAEAAPEPKQPPVAIAPAQRAPAPAAHPPKSITHAAAPPVASEPVKKPIKETSDCDEVTCMVTSETACCARLRGGHSTAAEPKRVAVDLDLPEKLVASTSMAAMSTVKPRVLACGTKFPAKGQVKLHVKVSGDARVDVVVESSPDPALGACVAAAVKTATFPKTQTGGAFAFPYNF